MTAAGRSIGRPLYGLSGGALVFAPATLIQAMAIAVFLAPRRRRVPHLR